MENMKDRVYKIIMLILICVTVTFMVTSIGMYKYFTSTDKGKTEVAKSIKISNSVEEINTKLQLVKEYLENHYIGILNDSKMIESAIKGYVEGLEDEYTEYLTKDEYEDLLVDVTGDYVGIGIYMYKNNDGHILVLTPIENSPAEEAGLQTNDIIVSIDGELCEDMDLDVASSKIKGQEGTFVEIELLRGTETINKKVERRIVEIADSTSDILEGNIGYIQLATFDEGSAENVAKYLSDFQNKKIDSVIIDLRSNTGGIVSEAIEMCEQFLSKGKVIMRLYNKTDSETIIKSTNSKPLNMNLVILVNDYSASATEIVAAAMQDNKVATIIGTKTYGKGVMQEVVPFLNGALKVTSEEFKTPNGNKIHKVGITPDIVVELSEESKVDEQLQAAIDFLKK